MTAAACVVVVQSLNRIEPQRASEIGEPSIDTAPEPCLERAGNTSGESVASELAPQNAIEVVVGNRRGAYAGRHRCRTDGVLCRDVGAGGRRESDHEYDDGAPSSGYRSHRFSSPASWCGVRSVRRCPAGSFTAGDLRIGFREQTLRVVTPDPDVEAPDPELVLALER